MILDGVKVPVGSPTHNEVVEWLYTEAELLDDGEETRWLEDMVSREVVYRVPLRQTVERARGTGFAEAAYHLDETYGSLATRVARNQTKYAWAEDPPSRIRHFVSNVRVVDAGDGTLAVRSNLLILRTRQEQTVPQTFAGERRDVLRREDGVLRLYRRTVLLDLTVIGTHNLAIFF
ncbi:aromatic-ring-hydroxylating dioxygenase subunit beta [Pseudonocardia thermophila]|jgi:Small subunit of phenylpropionate dioxygenase|uniref:aromatic-ring-hydroxylating dioxygenase subunit beta n=1 Tax=Pseudonocardia thermophila TaxID=1848 RepID=UPI00248DA1CC|nr:aromatic-ring-hydroxylating dioxygenase subunit beta [Pseudonocardia thermophila]